MKKILSTPIRFGLYVAGGLLDIFIGWGLSKGFLDAADAAALVSLSAMIHALSAMKTWPWATSDQPEVG